MPFEPAPKKPGKLLALAKFGFAVGIIAACVAGMTSVPLALGMNAGVKTALNTWNSMDVAVQDPELPAATVMLTKQGSVIARFATYDRTVVTGEQISQYVKDALIATEDSRFWEHKGVDVVGLARAFVRNAQSSSTQGGSSITQQYVKNVELLQAELSADSERARAATERSLERKVGEARKAIALEKALSKDEILTRYLNLVNFGSGATGVEAAARRYYSKHASDLTIDQAATLIGIINRPSAYSPLVNEELAIDRRNHVLARMADTGYISAQQAQYYQKQALNLDPTLPERGCGMARPSWGHYCQAVLEDLTSAGLLGDSDEEAKAVWDRGGLVVVTELDEKVQSQAQQAVSGLVPGKSRVAGMIAVVKPGTGAVAGLAASKTYGKGPNQTEIGLVSRPFIGPGSTMKLFTLAAAVSQGIDLNTILPGGTSYTSPTSQNPESGAFNNYDNSYASNVSIMESIRRSLNTSMIQLSEQVGIRKVAELAKRMGASNLPLTGENAIRDDEGSLTLGARELSVVDMANSYATVAAEGKACTAKYVASITYMDNTTTVADQCEQVLTPAAARAVTYALREAVENGTGRSAALEGRDVAGKTGTSQDVSAAWFAGYTPQWAAAVALADPRGPAANPLVNVLGYSKVYGGTIPAAVFKTTMDAIHQGLPAESMTSELDKEYLLGLAPESTVLVPEVTGMSVDTAKTALKEAGLVGVSESSGTVVGSIPKAGREVESGQSVQLLTTSG